MQKYVIALYIRLSIEDHRDLRAGVKNRGIER